MICQQGADLAQALQDPILGLARFVHPRKVSRLIRSAGCCRCAGSGGRCELCAPPPLRPCCVPHTLSWSPPFCMHAKTVMGSLSAVCSMVDQLIGLMQQDN